MFFPICPEKQGGDYHAVTAYIPKNEQIRELNARLAECSTALLAAQETARAAKALHAGTIQQKLSEEDCASDSGPEEQAAPNNRRWFGRFFRR